MLKFKFVISSDSKVVDANGVIKQNGFSSFKLVPVSGGAGFEDIFNEYFPEYAEDLYRLDVYDAEIKAEADHISKMYKKYPNYRHD